MPVRVERLLRGGKIARGARPLTRNRARERFKRGFGPLTIARVARRLGKLQQNLGRRCVAAGKQAVEHGLRAVGERRRRWVTRGRVEVAAHRRICEVAVQHRSEILRYEEVAPPAGATIGGEACSGQLHLVLQQDARAGGGAVPHAAAGSVRTPQQRVERAERARRRRSTEAGRAVEH